MNWLEEIINNMSYVSKGGKNMQMTQYKFAQLAGLDRSHIKKIIDNNVPVNRLSIDTAEKIANALDMDLIEFLQKYHDKYKKS